MAGDIQPQGRLLIHNTDTWIRTTSAFLPRCRIHITRNDALLKMWTNVYRDGETDADGRCKLRDMVLGGGGRHHGDRTSYGQNCR